MALRSVWSCTIAYSLRSEQGTTSDLPPNPPPSKVYRLDTGKGLPVPGSARSLAGRLGQHLVDQRQAHFQSARPVGRKMANGIGAYSEDADGLAQVQCSLLPAETRQRGGAQAAMVGATGLCFRIRARNGPTSADGPRSFPRRAADRPARPPRNPPAPTGHRGGGSSGRRRSRCGQRLMAATTVTNGSSAVVACLRVRRGSAPVPEYLPEDAPGAAVCPAETEGAMLMSGRVGECPRAAPSHPGLAPGPAHHPGG